MSERNSSRLPFYENNSNAQIPVRTTWRQRPPTQQQPSLNGLAENSMLDERQQQYRDEYMDEIAEENDEKIAIIEGQRVKILDASCYTQMRKSEFFSKRLKKDSSATRLTHAIANQRMVSQGASGVRFGGSQQNWLPGSVHSGLKPHTQKETVSTANPTLTVIKPNQRKLMIASRDLKHATEAAAAAGHGAPDIHRSKGTAGGMKRQGETSTPLRSYHQSPDSAKVFQKQQNWGQNVGKSNNVKQSSKFQIVEANVYSEQDVPLLQRNEMRPARNTVYGVPFLDQQQNKMSSTFHKQSTAAGESAGEPQANNLNFIQGLHSSIKGSQDFEKTPLRGGQNHNQFLNVQNAASETNLIVQPDNTSKNQPPTDNDAHNFTMNQDDTMVNTAAANDSQRGNSMLTNDQAKQVVIPLNVKQQLSSKDAVPTQGKTQPPQQRLPPSESQDQLKEQPAQPQQRKQTSKVQRTTRDGQPPSSQQQRGQQQYHEYSPEYNRNVSLTTSATITVEQQNNPSNPSFQIQISKKQQVEKFLTKEVKPDQTSLLFYNFNDYGLKGGAQPQPGQPSGDRVPSRQVTRTGSRRVSRGSSIGARGVGHRAPNTAEMQGVEEQPTPGIMVNPYEFGPPTQAAPVTVTGAKQQPVQIQPMHAPTQHQQHILQQRIGSPFNDYQRIQPIINNVIVQRNKHNKVVLPKLPKKGGKPGETDRTASGGQEGSGRSPLRTTSFCGIMEMIKEEEAQ